MPTQQEPYAYFQPGEIVYFISHESDQPINRRARDPETTRRIYVESNSPSSNQQFDPDDIDDDKDDSDEDEVTYDQKIDSLIEWSNTVAKELKLNLTISRDKKREIHFPGTLNEEPAKYGDPNPNSERQNYPPEPRSRGAFSLIPAEVRLPKAYWHSQTNPEGFVDTHTLAELVVGLDKERNREDQPIAKYGITCGAVMPAWLYSSCSEWGGGGGPGGIPEPYEGRSEDLHPFELPSQKAGLQAILGKEGQGVTVAVLDTSPTLHDLAEAYERYHKIDPENQQEHHLLLEMMLKPDGPLTVHPASLEELLRMRAVHLRDHDYDMSAHGTFVVSILLRFAPLAKIHLYEVLNYQGVGDLMSIAQGFWRVFNRFSRRPLVVNCSIVCRIPRLNHPIKDLDSAFMKKIIKDWEAHEKDNIEWLTADMLSPEGEEWLARQGAAMEWICDHFYYRGSRVIASAGNDWRPAESSERPSPGFPAAFDRVLGVGAMPIGALADASGLYPVSTYSNLSDEPEIAGKTSEVGVATLGGEAGEKSGIIGVYIGKFPDMQYRLKQYPWYLRPVMWVLFTLKWGNCIRPENKNCKAWWCGTSFAAPIFAGLAAAVLSNLNQPARTQLAINEMYDVKGISFALTADKEDTIEEIRQL